MIAIKIGGLWFNQLIHSHFRYADNDDDEDEEDEQIKPPF